jgi:hypothetical protein
MKPSELSRIVDRALGRLDRHEAMLDAPESGADLDELGASLATEECDAALALDPYWPKWDAPWWRLTLLFEAGRLDLAPAGYAARFLAAVSGNCIPHFPLVEAEIPPGIDTCRNICCFCALGTALRIGAGAGLEPFVPLPWAADWPRRYQLPDGGFNCEEGAYTASRKSSFLSTLPMLEAWLETGGPGGATSSGEKRAAGSPAIAFLAAGAAYLVEHRLVRSTQGALVDAGWFDAVFPRFYFYDALRGLSFLARHAVATGTQLPVEALAESVAELERRCDAEGFVLVGREHLRLNRTIAPGPDGNWTGRAVGPLLPALERLSRPGTRSLPLTREWRATLRALRTGALLLRQA